MKTIIWTMGCFMFVVARQLPTAQASSIIGLWSNSIQHDVGTIAEEQITRKGLHN